MKLEVEILRAVSYGLEVGLKYALLCDKVVQKLPCTSKVRGLALDTFFGQEDVPDARPQTVL